MSKITKKLLEDYKATKKVVKKSKFAHQQNVDKIKEIIKPLVDAEYLKHPCYHNITGIEFCNDNDYKIENLPREKDWIEISEDEYYRIYHNNNRNKDSIFNTEIKTEDTLYPDYNETYFKMDIKYRDYLRVYVHESWGYGGNDDVRYDFLLSDIMDEQYLRKEKLLKLQKLEETV
jgi:hypothetical protein